jgi:hypothetical protein
MAKLRVVMPMMVAMMVAMSTPKFRHKNSSQKSSLTAILAYRFMIKGRLI